MDENSLDDWFGIDGSPAALFHSPTGSSCARVVPSGPTTGLPPNVYIARGNEPRRVHVVSVERVISDDSDSPSTTERRDPAATPTARDRRSRARPTPRGTDGRHLPSRAAGASRDNRGVSPVVAVAALLALTVGLAAVLAVSLGGFVTTGGLGGPVGSVGMTFDLAVTADPDSNGTGAEIALTYVSGDSIDVEALSMVIAVNGTTLTHQPPIPYTAAKGFRSIPSGPFNEQSSGEFSVGDRAALTVAGSNDPTIHRGDVVTVSLSLDGQHVARLEATVT